MTLRDELYTFAEKELRNTTNFLDQFYKHFNNCSPVEFFNSKKFMFILYKLILKEKPKQMGEDWLNYEKFCYLHNFLNYGTSKTNHTACLYMKSTIKAT